MTNSLRTGVFGVTSIWAWWLLGLSLLSTPFVRGEGQVRGTVDDLLFSGLY